MANVPIISTHGRTITQGSPTVDLHCRSNSRCLQDCVWLTLLVFLAALMLSVSLRWGIGISPDSTTYIEGARHLLAGEGYVRFLNGEIRAISHFPLGYSMALASVSRMTGLEPVDSAKTLACFLLSLNLVLVFLLGRLWSHSRKTAWLSVLLMGVAPDFFLIHHMAWSEPLFVLLSLASLIALERFHQQGSHGWLMVSSAMLALALLTRFIGVVIIGSLCCWLLLFGEGTWFKRGVRSAVFGAGSTMPMMLWLLFLKASGSQNPRSWGVHLVSMDTFQQGCIVMVKWFSPWTSEQFAINALVLLIVCVLLMKACARQRDPFSVFVFGYVLFYLGFLVLSISFMDKNTPMSRRILSPLLPFVGVLTIQTLCTAPMACWLRRSIVIALLGLQLQGGFAERRSVFQHGRGYASRVVKTSETLNSLARMPPQMKLYSNAPDLISFTWDRVALSIPEKTNLLTGKAHIGFRGSFEAMIQRLNEEASAIVYFECIDRPQVPTLDEILAAQEIRTHRRFADGAILTGLSGPSTELLQSAGVKRQMPVPRKHIAVPIGVSRLDIQHGQGNILGPHTVEFHTSDRDLFFVWVAPEPVPVLAVEYQLEIHLNRLVEPHAWTEVFLECPSSHALIQKRRFLGLKQGQRRVQIVFANGTPQMTSLLRIDPITGPGRAIVSEVRIHVPAAWRPQSTDWLVP